MTSSIPTSGAAEVRRILLVEPVFHVHALVYCEAALVSTGFENARITIASWIHAETHRERMAAFVARQPRAELRLLDGQPSGLTNRLQNWRTNRDSMRQVEAILRAEPFDLVAYMMADNILPFLAFRRYRREFPGHWTKRVSGAVFRDNGLRPPIPRTWQARARAFVDRFVLGRAVRSPAVRRLAFLDPWCAERASKQWNGDRCRRGVDAIFLPSAPPDANEARARLGVSAGVFTVLLFGSFSERKGIIQTLEILSQLTLSRTLHVLLGGPVDPAIRRRFDAAVAAVRKRHPVHHHDGFVPDADMPAYFAAADLVLCVYKDFTGSSGILLHAAAYGKPALVAAGGVMADAVTKYEFGEVVPLDGPAAFAAAVARFEKLDPNERAALRDRALAYAKLNDARLYLSQFL